MLVSAIEKKADRASNTARAPSRVPVDKLSKRIQRNATVSVWPRPANGRKRILLVRSDAAEDDLGDETHADVSQQEHDAASNRHARGDATAPATHMPAEQ